MRITIDAMEAVTQTNKLAAATMNVHLGRPRRTRAFVVWARDRLSIINVIWLYAAVIAVDTLMQQNVRMNVYICDVHAMKQKFLYRASFCNSSLSY